jgi:TatD DNase family protein
MIDTHAHLDDERFAADLPEVLRRAADNGLSHILTIGVDRVTSEAAVNLAERHPMLRAVVGIQPNYVAEVEQGDIDVIEELARLPVVVGIGESGLDRYWDKTPINQQALMFLHHLRLAKLRKKPIVIHCREAEADVVQCLAAFVSSEGPIRGVMHSFAGDAGTMHECLKLGLHISFAGMVTYKNAANLRELIAQVPDDRLLIETDSPYLAPVPVRGKRNEPAYVRHTAECVANVRGTTVEVIDELTTRNARELFNLTC